MNNKIDLSEFFITKNQASDFIQSLNSIIDQLYETGFNLEKTLSDEFGIDKKDKFVSLLRDLKVNTSSNDTLKQVFHNLQESVRKLPILTLTIAFEPNETALKTFLQWYLFTFNSQVLIDIKVDRNLIAGATINFNGKFKNYSVKPIFENIINKNMNINNVKKENSQVNNNHINIQ